MHAPRYEWHPELHVQGLDEEVRLADHGDGGISPQIWC